MDTPLQTLDLTPDSDRWLLFEAGGEALALPLSAVQQVANLGQVARLPRTPSWLLGLTSLDGEIYSVVDLALLVAGTATDSRSAKLVIVRSANEDLCVGMLVTQVGGVRPVAADASKDRSGESLWRDYAIGQVDCDGNSVQLLDPERLLSEPNLRQFDGKPATLGPMINPAMGNNSCASGALG